MKKIHIFILLFISLLSFNPTIFAQDNAPSYQSMIQLGDKEYNKGEYIKAKSYYQEALRIKKDDANAKSKLNKLFFFIIISPFN